LKLREIPNLLLREPDICKCVLVKGCYASVYLRLRKTEIFAVPPVKADGHFANSIVAAVCDVGERALDRDPDLGLDSCGGGGIAPSLQINGHKFSL
jgi:hypothetical protein